MRRGLSTTTKGSSSCFNLYSCISKHFSIRPTTNVVFTRATAHKKSLLPPSLVCFWSPWQIQPRITGDPLVQNGLQSQFAPNKYIKHTHTHFDFVYTRCILTPVMNKAKRSFREWWMMMNCHHPPVLWIPSKQQEVRRRHNISVLFPPARSDDCMYYVFRMQLQFLLKKAFWEGIVILREISAREKKKSCEPANVWGRDTAESTNLSIVFINHKKKEIRGDSKFLIYW